MKNFDIKRFWYTFRWYFIENRRHLFSWVLGLTLGFMAVESFFLTLMLRQTDVAELQGASIQSIAIWSSFSMCVVVGMLAVLLAFSAIFSFLKTKQKRIAYFTLPCTNLERYLSALLFTLVVWPVCILIAFVLGDTLRMLVFGILGEGWFSSLSLFYNFFAVYESGCSFNWTDCVKLLFNNATILWGCSIYILGGTWFRRGAFLIVTFGQIVLATIVSWLTVTLFGDHIEIVFDLAGSVQNKSMFVYVTIVVFFVAALFNFWLSYQLFKRFQIIPSKWTNL